MVTENLKKFSTPSFSIYSNCWSRRNEISLQLNVIDPKIGGVMIMGDRGTGKSTTIRAIADLLPEIEVVKDDPFNSHKSDLDLMGNEVKLAIQNNETLETELIKIPMVDLPLGATEDRVCGTIDIEKALTEGVKAFEPGLLSKSKSRNSLC
jgi:magnesium chelatase subunit I